MARQPNGQGNSSRRTSSATARRKSNAAAHRRASTVPNANNSNHILPALVDTFNRLLNIADGSVIIANDCVTAPTPAPRGEKRSLSLVRKGRGLIIIDDDDDNDEEYTSSDRGVGYEEHGDEDYDDKVQQCSEDFEEGGFEEGEEDENDQGKPKRGRPPKISGTRRGRTSATTSAAAARGRGGNNGGSSRVGKSGQVIGNKRRKLTRSKEDEEEAEEEERQDDSKRLKLYVMGGNENGELGIGDTRGRDVAIPTVIKSLQGKRVRSAAVGGMHCAVLVEGEDGVMTW